MFVPTVQGDPMRGIAVWAAAATSAVVVLLHYVALQRVPPAFSRSHPCSPPAWSVCGAGAATPYFRFVALGLVLAPVPAALTYDFSHELRNIEAVPFFAIVMVPGVLELAPLLTRQRALAAAMAAVLGLQAVSLLSDYFTRTPERMSGWQQKGLQQAVRDAQAASGRIAPVVVSSQVFSGDFMYAFYSGEDVRTYRTRGVTGASYRPLDAAAGHGRADHAR